MQPKSWSLVRRGGVLLGHSLGSVIGGSVHTTEGVYDRTIGKRLLNTDGRPANLRANQRVVGVSVRPYVRHHVLQLSTERAVVTGRGGTQARQKGTAR